MLDTWEDDTVKNGLPRMDTARKVADVILNVSSASNGKVSQKSYDDLEEQTGMTLKDISSERASEKITLGGTFSFSACSRLIFLSLSNNSEL